MVMDIRHGGDRVIGGQRHSVPEKVQQPVERGKEVVMKNKELEAAMGW